MPEDAAFAPDRLRSLKRRLVTAAVLWLVLLVLGGVWLDHARINAYRATLAGQQTQRLETLQGNIEGHFRTVAALGKVLVAQPHLASLLSQPLVPVAVAIGPAALPPEALKTRLMTRPEVRAMCQQLSQLVNEFQIKQAYLQDARGYSVADSAWEEPFTTVGSNFSARPYFQQAMATGSGFQHVVGLISHKPGFIFSTRVTAANGQALGVLLLKTDQDTMARLLADSLGRVLLLADANQVVVASNVHALNFTQWPGGPTLDEQKHSVNASYPSKPVPQNWPMKRLTVQGKSEEAVLLDGQWHLAESRTLQGFPYTTWVLTPLAAEPAIHGQDLGYTVLALLLGWGFCWAYARRQARSRELEQARLEALGMMRTLPLTLFRYRVSPEGTAHFSYLGAGVHQLLGLHPADLAKQPEAPWRQAGLVKLRPPTVPHEFALELQGRKSWISVNSALATDAAGEQVYDGYWLDISARRQAELRFDMAFTHAHTPMFFFHRQQGLLRSNAATQKLFGVDRPEEMQGQRTWLFPFSPRVQPSGQPSEQLAMQILTGYEDPTQPKSVQWQFRQQDGKLVDVEVRLIWLRHEDPDLYFAMAEDISARQQAEAALVAASRTALETSRAKSAFLANMSHEIRTPMNAIIGMTHLALDEPDPAKARNYVQKAHEAANGLLQIINDVLDISKIEAGQMELESVDFSLQALLDQVSLILGLPAENKGLELIFCLPPDLPAHLQGDPTRLRQILVNLGANAIKFTDQGSVTLGLEVAQQKDHALVLHGWVQDTGIGMSAEEQQRLFQPFMQADASTTRRFGGTGLGLTISRQLAEGMGGRLWVESAAGQGATFHFTVTMAVPPHPQAMATAKVDWLDKRVLLVDDNPDARRVLGAMVTALGLQVDLADSGEQALQCLRAARQPYDWILIDWKMPGMDGLTCAQHILALSETQFPGRKQCILLVTAFNRDDAVQAARNIPLADVLTKPVTPSTLFDSLTRAMGGPVPLRMTASRPLVPASGESPVRLQGMRVLVVDDQPLNQLLARELLVRVGAEVVLAVDGVTALEALEAAPEPFDCVLMDCQMPRMDGYTATRKIREQARWQHLPIIAMTASALVSDREQALAAGMNDHVAKPLDVQQMYHVIERWVSAARSR